MTIRTPDDVRPKAAHLVLEVHRLPRGRPWQRIIHYAHVKNETDADSYRRFSNYTGIKLQSLSRWLRVFCTSACHHFQLERQLCVNKLCIVMHGDEIDATDVPVTG